MSSNDRLSIKPAATWENLALPRIVVTQLREICNQVGRGRSRSKRPSGRGKGLAALFTGPPRTGKTMAAEVIANELGSTLYRVELSAVTGKYIGETEKNLRRLFDAAEELNAVLFFDEADALFGKRSEVKESNDRYANIGVNYLLQRLEDYSGLVILTTNRKENLDAAFLRRLRYIVDIPAPRKKSGRK